MKRGRTPDRSKLVGWRRCLRGAALLALAATTAGCEVDSWFNPSVTGYWERQPTTIPILERIDVIETQEDFWGQMSSPTPDDLVPNDLTYRTVPGDLVRIAIYELLEVGQWSVVDRRIDAGGYLRVPELGEVESAGLTAQEIEDKIVVFLEANFVRRPQVEVSLEQLSAFNYTLYGAIRAPGLYSLFNPDMRLIDALASAGGVPIGVKSIFIVRQVPLTEEVQTSYQDDRVPASTPDSPIREPINIEDLIEQLDDGDVRPGALQDQEPVVDIDDLLPPPPSTTSPATPDGGPPVGGNEGTWMFVEERGEWIRVPTGGEPGAESSTIVVPGGGAAAYARRIIKIPVDRLRRGDSRYNVVVRPKDRIYLQPPPSGVVYIDGFINRPGTFTLPADGITLSRLVAAAGGLGQLAIPERVDLVRMVGDNREAAIRLNLAAIRQRTEPDVLLKPNDHIIIGTNFWATPLAVIRNGFRMTYGFGFLLDRNFGNDVFGAPPSNFN